MKSHNKYAKLPQDLDLSFQEQLDVDAGVSDEFNLAAGIGLADDTDDDEHVPTTTTATGDLNAVSTLEGHAFDDEEDEIVIATALSGGGGIGTRANVVGSAAASVRVNTSANSGDSRKVRAGGGVAVGLGSDSVIEVSGNFSIFIQALFKLVSRVLGAISLYNST